eukprot:473292-Pyramimonas_sp.AAC.1
MVVDPSLRMVVCESCSGLGVRSVLWRGGAVRAKESVPFELRAEASVDINTNAHRSLSSVNSFGR